MGRTLYFQQVTDSRSEENILELLTQRVNKLKELLNIDGIEIQVTEPELIEWNHRDWSSLLKDYIDKHYQYRSSFFITKNTRKLSWNDIYKIVNSVKAVPYSFL